MSPGGAERPAPLKKEERTMATTAQQVFETAMALMDQLGTDGSPNTADNREYRDRTLPILNALRGELYPYSDTCVRDTRGGRPIAAAIRNMDEPIGLDDHICQSILPYALAAHLLLDENPSAASFFQQRYEELKNRLAVGMPAKSEDIEDLYGGIEYGQFGRW